MNQYFVYYQSIMKIPSIMSMGKRIFVYINIITIKIMLSVENQIMNSIFLLIIIKSTSIMVGWLRMRISLIYIMIMKIII